MNLFTLAQCIADASDEQPQGIINVTDVVVTAATLQVTVWISRFTHYRMFARMVHRRFPAVVILDNHVRDAMGSSYVVCAPSPSPEGRGRGRGVCAQSTRQTFVTNSNTKFSEFLQQNGFVSRVFGL